MKGEVALSTGLGVDSPDVAGSVSSNVEGREGSGGGISGSGIEEDRLLSLLPNEKDRPSLAVMDP